MPIPAECPSCAYKGRVPDNFKGRKVKCPWCDHMFTVGGEAGATDTHYPGTQKAAAKPGAKKPDDSDFQKQAAKTLPSINVAGGGDSPFNFDASAGGAAPVAGKPAGKKKLGGSHPGTVPVPKLSDSQPGKPTAGSHPGTPIAKLSQSHQGVKKKMGGSHAGTTPIAQADAKKKVGGSHAGTPFADLDAPAQAASTPADAPRKKSAVGAILLGVFALFMGLGALVAAALPLVLPELGVAALAGVGLGVFGGLFGLLALLLSLRRFSLVGMGASFLASGVCALALYLAGPPALDLAMTSLGISGAGTQVVKDGEPKKDGDMDGGKAKDPPDPPAGEWADIAKDQPSKVGPIMLRVESAAIEYPKGKNLASPAAESLLLHVRLAIVNSGMNKANYVSWGAANAMADAQPILTDDMGAGYKRADLGPMAQLVGQTLKGELAGGGFLNDVVVFEAPKGANYLRLELPAGNVGEQGKFKFHIPWDSITITKDKPPDPVPTFDPAKLKQVKADLNSFKKEDRVKATRQLSAAAAQGADISELVPDLIVALEDKEDEVRQFSATALGGAGKKDHEEVVRALIKALQGEDELPKVKVELCKALGKLGPAAKDAAAALEKLFEDPDKEVAAAAKEAHKKVSS